MGVLMAREGYVAQIMENTAEYSRENVEKLWKAPMIEGDGFEYLPRLQNMKPDPHCQVGKILPRLLSFSFASPSALILETSKREWWGGEQ